jgi:hypothetical protein
MGPEAKVIDIIGLMQPLLEALFLLKKVNRSEKFA